MVVLIHKGEITGVCLCWCHNRPPNGLS